jgi:ankyrin repeat protein
LDKWKQTPLHNAAIKGHESVAMALIDANAAVDALDKWKATPLHKAAMFGHDSIAMVLIDANASVELKDACCFGESSGDCSGT